MGVSGTFEGPLAFHLTFKRLQLTNPWDGTLTFKCTWASSLLLLARKAAPYFLAFPLGNVPYSSEESNE